MTFSDGRVLAVIRDDWSHLLGMHVLCMMLHNAVYSTLSALQLGDMPGEVRTQTQPQGQKDKQRRKAAETQQGETETDRHVVYARVYQ